MTTNVIQPPFYGSHCIM